MENRILKNFIIITLLSLCLDLSAQKLTYKSSWLGNSFGDGKDKWVQNDIDEIDVAADGTVFSASYWDEHGRCSGIYKDGDVLDKPTLNTGGNYGFEDECWGWGTGGKAVASDADNFYIINCQGRLLVFKRSTQQLLQHVPGIGETIGLTEKAGKLYIVRTDGTIQRRPTSDVTTIEKSFTVTGSPTDIAIDDNGDLWILTGITIKHYSNEGEAKGGDITENGWKPNSVSFDTNSKNLIITDNSTFQVKFYNISAATPVLAKTFGQSGGIMAGTPGIVLPDKFWTLTGAATDANGNLYVSMSDDGCAIRKFDLAGNQVWEVLTTIFIDNYDADPASNGTEIYGVNERITYDYSKPMGQGWKLTSLTHDLSDTSDPRTAGKHDINVWASTFMRRLEGKLFKYITGMMAHGMKVYRFDGEISRYCEDIEGLGWAFFPDKYGNIWLYQQNKIKKMAFKGLTAEGCPDYGAAETVADLPAPFNLTGDPNHDGDKRLDYDADRDVMFISGYTKEKPYDGTNWGLMGSVLARYPNWSKGNRTPSNTITLPLGWNMPTESMSVCEDYVFVIEMTGQPEGQIHVYKSSDLSFVGNIYPGEEIGGNSGWIDIPYGIRALKRSNGEYVIFAEDGRYGRLIVYTWCPTGICEEVTSTNETELEKSHLVKVYPVPTNGNNLIINYHATIDGTAEIKVYTLLGISLISEKVKLHKGGNELMINTRNLKAGTYTLEIVTHGKKENKLIVVSE